MERAFRSLSLLMPPLRRSAERSNRRHSSSTERWNDVPRGTMDEVSSHVCLDLPFLTARPPDRLFHLVLESHDGRAPGADSEEKHEPVSDIDTVVVDSLKALDPEWPIREADVHPRSCYVAFVPKPDPCTAANDSKSNAGDRSTTARHRSVSPPAATTLVPCG